jgi:3-oxoacyl-[acyl-carrier-protein] synthase III
MNEMEATAQSIEATVSFYNRPLTKLVQIPLGSGVPLGFEPVLNPDIGIGGVYGSWGFPYDNQVLQNFVEERLGRPLDDSEKMNLSELGFDCRHHTPLLSKQEHLELEVQVGARFLIEAATVNGWDPQEVDAVMIGISSPTANDFLQRIAQRAGIPDKALKVAVHKACDGSMGALHLALNPGLRVNHLLEKTANQNIAETLRGKKVLVGGIEGLSRFLQASKDVNAYQLFGNAAGVIGVVPGETMTFLTGKDHEVFDDEGVLQVRMSYPYETDPDETGSKVMVAREGENTIRIAGKMHEPVDGSSVVMAGLMGMVKLFVRSGVEVVSEVHRNYLELMQKLGTPERSIAVAIVHHANLKINKLKEKHLQKEGVRLPMPWLLTEFGNVSAASNMIAFLRQLPSLKPGNHILFDGFGAGTYYDVFAVEMGAG